MKNVSCVILAGGFGTRLCPLTDSKPKPLVRILDSTVLELAVNAVKKTDAKKIVLSTFYKSDMIDALCREKFPDVICKREMSPLGTAGGVKNCFDGSFEALLVVSGDAVFDFDLQKVIDFHFENNADATVVVSRKDDPTNFGVVIADEEGNITSFSEKPAWKNVMSDGVNTGIYVLSEKVISEIPDGCEYDFSKNLFPKLLCEKRCVKAYFADGFWCDVGTLDEYFACNVLSAKGRLLSVKDKGQTPCELRKCGIHADDGVYVSEKASVGRNVRISKGSVVCNGAIVGDDCDVVRSIVGRNTSLGKGCSINGAIIGENVSVGENCIVPDGTVIGDGGRISDGTVLRKRQHIASGKAVFREDVEEMGFSVLGNLFADDGLVVTDEKDYERKISLFTKAVNRTLKRGEKRNSRVCVVADKNAHAVKNLVCSFFALDGAVVFDCGEGNESMGAFAPVKLETDASLYVCLKDDKLQFKLFLQDGNAADDEFERKTQKVYSALCDEEDSFDVKKGSITQIKLCDVYENALVRYVENILGMGDLSDVSVTMLRDETSNNPSSRVLESVLGSKNCSVLYTGDNKTINVSISDDGRRVKIRCGTRTLDHNHACAVVLKNADLIGCCNVRVSDEAPNVLKSMKKSNENSTDFAVTDDGAVCALAFLCVLKKSGFDGKDLFSDVPEFEIFTDEYVADVNRGATMERLSKLYHDSRGESREGIRLNLAEGTVTVVPNRMKGFKIVSEAQSMEAAKELAVKIGKAIKEKE